ncbi:hypothetical protein L1887_39145 [Cichorium endivia]|nr:hypothetical protein L1887_39145 [Cichorium endivia]
MTTLEKLFVQIFEKKEWIIELIQRQADAYNEQLACRLLIDGITPPPCLLNPRFNSHPSDPHGLKKEEIISKLLLGPPRDSIAYSSGGPSMYYRPVVTGGNVQLPNKMSMETHAPNKVLNLTNGPPVTLVCPNDDIGCSLNVVTKQDNSVNSPQSETDARISSIYAAPDTSLAKIQRSKSRQKARELRTSGKSCLGDENRTRISFTVSKSDTLQVTQDKSPSEPAKCNDKEELDGGVNLHETSLGSYGAKKSESSKTHDTDGLCMLVKPKQLNFNEMDGCDSSKISNLVSKKRKLDGLLGQEWILIH